MAAAAGTAPATGTANATGSTAGATGATGATGAGSIVSTVASNGALQTHCEWQTETAYSADSVEFCPAPEWSSYFAAGNYQLLDTAPPTDGKPQNKVGAIYIFQLTATAPQSNATAAATAASTSAPATTVAPTAATAIGVARDSAAAKNGDVKTTSALHAVERQRVSTEAILDLKWCPRPLQSQSPATYLLGAACTRATLALYQFAASDSASASTSGSGSGSGSPSLKPFADIKLTEDGSGTESDSKIDSVIALSLDWNNRVIASAEPCIIVSQSNQRLSYCQLTSGSGGLIRHSAWRAHDLEVWIAAFDSHTPSTVYSGSDDTQFKGWDVRSPLHKPVFIDKSHTAGVTSLHSNPHQPFVLATGSYDEKIRIFDLRSLARPIQTVTHSIGGGVWRLKWHPNPEFGLTKLLAAGMHNGFHVVDIYQPPTEATTAATAAATATAATATATATAPTSVKPAKAKWKAATVASYMRHTSLAYGSDWCYAPPQQFRPAATTAGAFSAVVGSCSFYDKQLHVWSVQ